jgi:hypothetical protein
MLHRTLSPGDVLKISGPCDIRIKRSKGRMNAYFEAPETTRIVQVPKKRQPKRVDKPPPRHSD